MTHKQIIDNYSDVVATLFATYGITQPVSELSLERAMIEYDTFADDLNAQLGLENEHENFLKGVRNKIKNKVHSVQANHKQKKTDKANGIKTKRGHGRKKHQKDGSTPLSNDVQEAKDKPDADGSVHNDVQDQNDVPNKKKNFMETTQAIMDGAGAVLGAGAGLIKTLKGGGKDDDEDESNNANTNNNNNNNTEPSTFMDKLKKYWYVPVIVVVVIVIAVVVVKSNPKAGK